MLRCKGKEDFTKEDIRTANKFMKKVLNLIWNQGNASYRKAKIKESINTKYWWKYRAIGTLIFYWWDGYNHFENDSVLSSKFEHIYIYTNDPVILLPVYTHINVVPMPQATCTRMLMTALFNTNVKK